MLAGQLMVGGEPVVTVITYTYDPLSRLTAADYEDRRFFHYQYVSIAEEEGLFPNLCESDRKMQV